MSTNIKTLFTTSPTNSAAIFVSSSPTTPITSNVNNIFYLPYPSSSSSSSTSTTDTHSVTEPEQNSTQKSTFSSLLLTPVHHHHSNFLSPNVSQLSNVVKPRVPPGFKIMSDDEDSSSSDVSSQSTELPEDNDNDAASVATTTDNSFLQQNTSLTDMAAALIEDNNISFNLSTEEESLIKDSTVNTKRYEKSKSGIEERFFETIETYGGPQLLKLLPIITVNKGTERDRAFYFLLRGKRTEQKRIILSKCLLLCALKWRNNKKKYKGKPLQPRTMAQLLKVLFAIFRSKHIKYNHKRDFNGDGEFHAILKKQWDEEMKKDPTFATGVGTSTFDYEADRKIRDAYLNKSFDPFAADESTKAYDDRKRYLVFVLGRYFFLRGRKELAFLKWNQINFCEETVNGNAMQYIEVRHKWDKSHQLKLTNPAPRDENSVWPRVRPNSNDPLCPYKFITFYRSLCVPTQERVFCQNAHQKLLREFRANNQPYLYNPKKPIGENSIDGNTKEFAREMGFENWERCTNHGNRKLAITTAMTNADKGMAPVILGVARQKDFKTSLIYQKQNQHMYDTYDSAIVGKHVKSPPKNPRDLKQARIKEEETRPPPVVAFKQEKEEEKMDEQSLHKLRDTDSTTTEQTGGILATYQTIHQPPLVTPANYPPTKTIVQQNHLNHIQRNIFLQQNSEYPYWPHNPHQPKDHFQIGHQRNHSVFSNYDSITADPLTKATDPSEHYLHHYDTIKKNNNEEKKELIEKINWLEQQLSNTKEKYQEQLSSYKEKNEDLKHELRAARQNAKLADMHLATSTSRQNCIIL
jgi:hypothetical protein